MSAFASTPQPAPEVGPERVDLPRPGPGRKKWLIVPVLIAAAAGAAWLVRTRQAAKPAALLLVRTARVVRGDLDRTLRLSGTLSATNFANITAPLMRAPDAGRGQVLIYLPPPGVFVKKGDVLARLDAQAIKDHLDDVEAMVDQTYMDLRKLKAQEAAQMESILQNGRVAKANVQKAQQDMRSLPVRSMIDREKYKLALEEAQAIYGDAQREVPLTVEHQAAEWRNAEINQEQQVRHRDRHRVDVTRFTITAPIDGQVVMKPIWRNGEQGQVQLGDELAPGQPFMRIVNPSVMQLDTSINQVDAEFVRLGQRATIWLDAYPGLVLEGKVEAVGTMALGGRRTNYYIRDIPVRIAAETKDPRAIPDLTASADVVIGEQDNTLLIPREAVQEEDRKSVVYVKQPNGFVPRKVELGMANDVQVAVTSGLKAGEEIALQPPSPAR